MNKLEAIIRDVIAAQGPLSLAAFMELALQHPEFGYYRVRNPLGRTGDFITAPEVSQMFGEIVGVWCAEAWRALGKPSPFALVEFGPGNGTMMQDVLRATKNVAGFHEAMKLFLVESDEKLREKQGEKLAEFRPVYVGGIGDAPGMPCLVLANEFFDALPIRQFEKTFQGWAERMVGVQDDSLAVVLRALSKFEMNLIPAEVREALPGTVVELSSQAQAMMREIARHLALRRGAMLVIDYGYATRSGSSTLQAVSNHAATEIFDRPGEVDLTAHVDFEPLAAAARKAGLVVSPLVGQGEFLRHWGIEIRAEVLKKKVNDAQKKEIDSALCRLVAESDMGVLFKVLEARSSV